MKSSRTFQINNNLYAQEQWKVALRAYEKTHNIVRLSRCLTALCLSQTELLPDGNATGNWTYNFVGKHYITE